jgi:hypothetical protein
MRSDDLVPFLSQPGGTGKGLSFRQGVVVSWDQDTAENIVLVGDTLLENLPSLNSTEASLLVPGDVVGILVSGATWAIIGRLIIPGSPEAATAINAVTQRIVAASDPWAGTRNSTSWGDLTGVGVGPEVTARIRATGRALVMWSAELGNSPNWNVRNTPHVGVELSGANTEAPSDLHSLNINAAFPISGQPGHAQMSFWLQAGVFHLYTGLNPGDTTFTLKYKHDTMSPAGATAFEAREIAVFVL